jgi:hypothetical protein
MLDLSTSLALALPAWLGWIAEIIGGVGIIIVHGLLWPVFMLEDLILAKRQHGWLKMFGLLLAFGLAILGGTQIVHIIPLGIGGWTWAIGLGIGYVVIAALMVLVDDDQYAWKVLGTILGVLWFFLAFTAASAHMFR